MASAVNRGAYDGNRVSFPGAHAGSENSGTSFPPVDDGTRLPQELCPDPRERAPPIEIYPAGEDSIRFVVEYCHPCAGPDGGGLPYAELLDRYLRRLQSGRYRCFIAAFGGQSVGYVDLEVRPHEGRDTLWIGDLYVVPERRREGLGVALVQHALAFARGWAEVHATTEPDNPGGLGALKEPASRWSPPTRTRSC